MDTVDEWSRSLSDCLLHAVPGSGEDAHHVPPLEVAASEHETAYSMGNHGPLLRLIEPDPLVIGDDDPPPSAYFSQPHVVLLVIGEMLMVSLDVESQESQCLGEFLTTRSIEKDR